MPGRMQGKVALITGAARGQGRSHAIRVPQEGADIIAVDVCSQIKSGALPDGDRGGPGRDRAAGAEELDRRIVTQVADVRDRAPLAAAVQAGVAALGHLDVVVANAGIISLGNEDASPSAFFDTVGVDLVGVINTVEAAFPHLGPGASVICTGSMAALIPGGTGDAPGTAGYTHAKRAVARFTHDLALTPRVAQHPGQRRPPGQHRHRHAAERCHVPASSVPTLRTRRRKTQQPAFGSMHKLPVNTLEPNDISEAVLYLASDASLVMSPACS